MKTRIKITRLRKKHPEMTLQAIADEVGVTKAAVHQLLKRAGLPTRAIRSPRERLCVQCGKPTPGLQLTHPGQCKIDYYYVNVHCAFCVKPKLILKSVKRSAEKRKTKRFFCNRDHYHAFRNLPENKPGKLLNRYF